MLYEVITSPTTVHLQFHLLHSGNYRLFATVRIPGHTLYLADRTFHIDDVSSDFRRVELGEITLSAGEQTLTVELPPNGSIDSVELTAAALPMVAPLDGWKPDEPLTPENMAVTVLRALSLEELLPPRITSYNVCYTKLLRRAAGHRSVRCAGWQRVGSRRRS